MDISNTSFESDKNLNLRDKLIDLGEQQMQQNYQVMVMNKTIEETQQKGSHGLDQLYQQGNKLYIINTTNKDIYHQIKKVDRTTEAMRKRQFCMNCLLYFVAIALFVTIVTILGVKLSNRL